MAWTELTPAGKIEAICAAYQPGMSARDLGALLGCSRNGVIGVYARNKRLHETHPLPPSVAWHTKVVLPPKPVRAAVRPPEHEQLVGMGLMLLSSGRCRFALTDDPPHLFCGKPSDGNWCDKHRVVVYQPPRSR